MNSLSYEDIQWLMTEVTGDVCFLSHGQVRTVKHHADWPWGRNELLTARQVNEMYWEVA